MLGALALGVLSLARRAVGESGLVLRFVVAALIIALVAAAHDFLVAIGVLPFASPALLNIATPVLVIALGATLIDRFVRSLAEVEKTNADLETRIHEREQLLKRNFDRLRESERVKASAQERQRIMQDMHDGLGSQLLSSLMLVERGAMSNEQVAQILRESIDDMRLAIDALAADDSDLFAALGNMRFRMEPRLRAAGMELQWDARNLPEEVDLDPNAVLPVLRIVQEALTNAIKHSRARVVRVTLSVDHDGDSQWLSIRVTDNGRGLAATGNVTGRGMLNMKSRAARIAAFLKVESVPGAGTMILLRLPLNPIPGPTTRAMQLSLDTEAVIEQLRKE
jgi:signal transduction histidine kinase